MTRVFALVALLLVPGVGFAQAAAGAKQIVTEMVANEDAAAQHRDHFEYMSNERSDRTGGRLWTEKVVETSAGKIRFLLAEDGKPLSADRVAVERGRLAAIAADPAAFARRSEGQKDDDTHAKQMLDVLPPGFLFGPVQQDGPDLRMDFHPNPEYQPKSIEEHLLHGMSGTVWVEAHAMRLHKLEGSLPADVNIGFGLLATIHAGSHFSTERDPMGAGQWKTTRIDSAIDGRAILFKTIARNQQTVRTEFHRVANDMSVPDAVALAEQP